GVLRGVRRRRLRIGAGDVAALALDQRADRLELRVEQARANRDAELGGADDGRALQGRDCLAGQRGRAAWLGDALRGLAAARIDRRRCGATRGVVRRGCTAAAARRSAAGGRDRKDRNDDKELFHLRTASWAKFDLHNDRPALS